MTQQTPRPTWRARNRRTYRRRLFWVTSAICLLLAPALADATTTSINQTRVITTDGVLTGRTALGTAGQLVDSTTLHVEGATVFNGSATASFQINGTGISFGNWSTPFLGNLTNAPLTAYRQWTLPDEAGTIALLADVLAFNFEGQSHANSTWETLTDAALKCYYAPNVNSDTSCVSNRFANATYEGQGHANATFETLSDAALKCYLSPNGNADTSCVSNGYANATFAGLSNTCSTINASCVNSTYANATFARLAAANAFTNAGTNSYIGALSTPNCYCSSVIANTTVETTNLGDLSANGWLNESALNGVGNGLTVFTSNGNNAAVSIGINSASANHALTLLPSGNKHVQVADGADATKLVVFDPTALASGSTVTLHYQGSTSRTITFPDATDTLAALNLNQAWGGVQNFDGSHLQATNILDANGNVWLGTNSSPSAVNYVQINNTITGKSPRIVATGTDANLNLSLVPQGQASIELRDGADNTKRLFLNESGSSTGIDTTLATSSTTSRTLTLPDETSTLTARADNLGVFAATTSAQLASVLSDETGTAGNAVFSTAPTITNPVIANIAPGADFTVTQNSVTPFKTKNSGAVANTLVLDSGQADFGISGKQNGNGRFYVNQLSTADNVAGPVLGFDVDCSCASQDVSGASINNAYEAVMSGNALSAGSSKTITNAINLYLHNAPSAGTNVAISNPYVLYVDGGATSLHGSLTVTGASTTLDGTTITSANALTLTPTTSGLLPAAAQGALVYDSTNDQLKIGTSSGSPAYQVVSRLGVAETVSGVKTYSAAPLFNSGLLVNTASFTKDAIQELTPTASIAGSASPYSTPGFRVDNSTTTYTGGTAESSNLFGTYLGVPTFTAAITAGTSNTAATLYIENAPTCNNAGGATQTCTNKYAIDVPSGGITFNGFLLTGGSAQQNSCRYCFQVPSSAAGSSNEREIVFNPSLTETFTGATAQTGELDSIRLSQTTYTAATTTGTVTNAATVRIDGAPICNNSGGATQTCTNARALWVAGGLFQADGNALIGASGSSIGFYGATVQAQQTRAGQMTDNTGGAVSTTCAAIAAGVTYTQADGVAEKNCLASILAQYNKLDTIVHNLGLST